MQNFYIPKQEDDYSDILLTIGVAKLITLILNRNDIDNDIIITLKDGGPYYIVELSEPLKKEHFENLKYFDDVFPCIIPKNMKEKDKPKFSLELVDFTQGKKAKDWDQDEWKSSLLVQATGIPTQNKIKQDLYAIKDYFGEVMYLILKSLAIPGTSFDDIDAEFSKLLDQIRINEFAKEVKTIFSENELKSLNPEFDDILKKPDKKIKNNIKKLVKDKLSKSKKIEELTKQIDELYKKTKPNFTLKHNALREILPSRIKGLNMADVSVDSQIAPGNIKESWIIQYLILIGYYKLFTFKTISDRRGKYNHIYSVMEPNNIFYNDIIEIANKLEKRIRENFYLCFTIEKQNILYLCDFILVMLDHLEKFNIKKGRFHPKDYISGIKNVYLVSMGQQDIIKSIYDLNVPNWIILDEDSTKDDFKLVFEEFKYLVTPINDKNENIELLRELYLFFTNEDVRHLLDYYYFHAILAMKRMADNNAARIYTKRSVKFILEKLDNNKNKFYPILENEGFKNFARAIRNSTLVPIFSASSGNRQAKKRIKFGLLQDIKKASLTKQTFIVKLNEFAAEYNNENMMETFRGIEKTNRYLTISDIKEMTKLLDEYDDSRMLGSMLIAYGFARDNEKKELDEVKEVTSNE